MVYMLNRDFTKLPHAWASEGVDDEASRLRMLSLAVPARHLPKELKIKSDGPLPDIYEWSDGHFIFSQRARLVCEGLAPAKLEYIPISITGSDNLRLDAEYFYINGLVHDQLVDWAKTDRVFRGKNPEGRKHFSAPQSTSPGVVFFKPMPRHHIWQEANATQENGDVCFYSPGRFLLSDDLWVALDYSFQGQIYPYRIQ